MATPSQLDQKATVATGRHFKLRYKLDVYPAVILVLMNLKASLSYTDLF